MNKRYTNRFIEPVVRRVPGSLVVTHHGRRSGRTYRTPLFGFDSDNGVLIALTYGPEADWVKNVLAGQATIERGGVTHTVRTPHVVGRSHAWGHLPLIVRGALRTLRVIDFLRVELAVEDEASIAVS